MKKILIAFIILILIGTISGVILLGMTGIVPGLSKLIGADKPRNLQVTYTQQDASTAYTKNGVTSLPLVSSTSIKDSVRYEGVKPVSFSMTGSEITALFNANKWKYRPIKDVQFRINPDGSGEASGIIIIDQVLPVISLTHSTKEIEQQIEKFHIGGSPAFYVKGKVEVVNNKVTINPQAAEIGRIPIPLNLVKDNTSAIEGFIEDKIRSVPNLSVTSFKLQEGKVLFDGTMPEKEYIAQ